MLRVSCRNFLIIKSDGSGFEPKPPTLNRHFSGVAKLYYRGRSLKLSRARFALKKGLATANTIGDKNMFSMFKPTECDINI